MIRKIRIKKYISREVESRVSTKWLNLLAIFFCDFLRYFCEWNAMSFEQFAQNRKYFLRKLRMRRNFSFAKLAQNRKFYAKCNFLGKLSKIDILSLELNWRFVPYMKKILTYEYDNDYTTLNWLLPVTKSLNWPI